MSEETNISVEDVKKPRKLLKKVFANLLVGGGAVAQEALSGAITMNAPQMNKAALSAGQLLVSSIGAGSVKNKLVKNFLNGISAGASKDLVKSITDKITGALAPATNGTKIGFLEKIKAMFSGAGAPAGAGITADPVLPDASAESSDFL